MLFIKESHLLIGWEPCAAFCATNQPAQKIRVIAMITAWSLVNLSEHVVYNEYIIFRSKFWIWISCYENSTIEEEGESRTVDVEEAESWKHHQSQANW